MNDDLKHFPAVVREHRERGGYIGAILSVVVIVTLPIANLYTNGAAPQAGIRPSSFPQRPAVAAPLDDPLWCQNSLDGLQFRGAINHCPDGTELDRFCYSKCWYGALDRRTAL